MEETPNPSRAEAERLLGIAEKLLQSRDLLGSKEFAVLAQETEPLLEGSDQILAVADVLLAAEKRVNNHHDWYAILQLERRSDDAQIIRKQYRKLALLLHPDKNKYPLADQAFKLVADAWVVLSDSSKKPLYDNEFTLFSKVELSSYSKLPVRTPRAAAKKQGGDSNHNNVTHRNTQNSNYYREDQRLRMSNFWTTCPYCYLLYEYPRVYEGCCLRCQNCQRAFHAAKIPSLPPLVPGKEAYYCCWAFFPLGYVTGVSEKGKKNTAAGFPNWMPPFFQGGQNSGDGPAPASPPPPHPVAAGGSRMGAERTDGMEISGGSAPGVVTRKRGRPRKT